MMVRCPACSANLRVNPDRIGARSTSKCPRCQAEVPLPPVQDAAPVATIIVACPSCQSRLKAPAARVGSRSSCPKCHAQILIQAPLPLTAPGAVMSATSGSEQEESSNVATRRIDSRMFGRLGLGGSETPAAGVDLDAFVRSRAPSTPETSSTVAVPERSNESVGEPGLAASLMRPPVAEMGKIAAAIRETAENLTASGGNQMPAQASQAAGSGRPGGYPLPAQATRAEASPAGAPRASGARGDSRRAERHHAGGRYRPIRGMVSGGIAGALIGGVSAVAAVMQEALPFLSPLPLTGGTIGVPDSALRVALPVLLGALSGLVAAAGSPAGGRRPRRMWLRFAGSGLLMGTAFGLASGITTGAGMPVWPIAYWMRDLLLVGLLSPAVNRIIPTSNR